MTVHLFQQRLMVRKATVESLSLVPSCGQIQPQRLQSVGCTAFGAWHGPSSSFSSPSSRPVNKTNQPWVCLQRTQNSFFPWCNSWIANSLQDLQHISKNSSPDAFISNAHCCNPKFSENNFVSYISLFLTTNYIWLTCIFVLEFRPFPAEFIHNLISYWLWARQ